MFPFNGNLYLSPLGVAEDKMVRRGAQRPDSSSMTASEVTQRLLGPSRAPLQESQGSFQGVLGALGFLFRALGILLKGAWDSFKGLV